MKPWEWEKFDSKNRKFPDLLRRAKASPRPDGMEDIKRTPQV